MVFPKVSWDEKMRFCYQLRSSHFVCMREQALTLDSNLNEQVV